MALKLIINLSKKIPGPTEFSMISASCSLDAELTTTNDLINESQRLYALAETAIDQQLGITNAGSIINYSQPHSATAQPYPKNNRRAPAAITPAQRRLLDQLLKDTGASVAGILSQYRVASLDQLSCRDTSAIIDSLKQSASHP